MSIDSIIMTINGAEINMKGVTAEQLQGVISIFGVSAEKKLATPVPELAEVAQPKRAIKNSNKVARRKLASASLKNNQYESTSMPLVGFFGGHLATGLALCAAKKHKLVLISKETALPLSTPSMQVTGRFAIIDYLFSRDNSSVHLNVLLKDVSMDARLKHLTESALHNYLCDLILFGVVSKTKSGKGAMYQLSTWFLEQLEVSNG